MGKLVFSRGPEQSVIIDGRIKVKVIGIYKHRGVGVPKVRLLIEAPDGVRVDREEIHLRRESQEAAT